MGKVHHLHDPIYTGKIFPDERFIGANGEALQVTEMVLHGL